MQINTSRIAKENKIEQAKSILLKVTALLAFLAINLIGYRAFSMEGPVVEAVKIDNEAIPACRIASEGYVENKWKNIRIQVGNAIVAGAETLSDLNAKMKQLVGDHKCLPAPVPCTFATEGIALGSWVKHRLMVSESIAFGGNTTARIFEQLGELKKMGICE